VKTEGDEQSRSLERGPVPLFHPALVWERDRREFLRREMHIETRRRARDRDGDGSSSVFQVR
jgi:hypothetical protein